MGIHTFYYNTYADCHTESKKKNLKIKENDMPIDPVCHMEVEEKTAKAKSEYNGKKYYFCAVGCKVAFDKNPEKYLKAEPGSNTHKM
jgi:YHS domain-containing protein